MLKNLFRRPLWLVVVAIVLLALIPTFMFIRPLVGVHASGGGPCCGSPSLSVQPIPSSPGTTINIVGFNYPVNNKVFVYFQSKANGVVTAVTDGGGFFSANLTIPKTYTKGTHYYIYADSYTISMKVLFTFTKPSLSVDGSYYGSGVTYGSQTSLSINGFAANEAVKMMLDYGALGMVKVGTFATDSYGSVYVQQTLPGIPAGTRATLTATGAISGLTASTPVYENAAIALTPDFGPVGSLVQVNGGGFGSYETVQVSFQGAFQGTAKTTQKGEFALQFQVPSNASLTNFYNNVQAIGKKSGTGATTSFRVVPVVSLNPRSASVGQTVFATGSHFTPNAPVYIYLVDQNGGSSGGGGNPLGQTFSSSRGNINTSFGVPYGLVSGHTYLVAFVDLASGAEVTVRLHIL